MFWQQQRPNSTKNDLRKQKINFNQKQLRNNIEKSKINSNEYQNTPASSTASLKKVKLANQSQNLPQLAGDEDQQPRYQGEGDLEQRNLNVQSSLKNPSIIKQPAPQKHLERQLVGDDVARDYYMVKEGAQHKKTHSYQVINESMPIASYLASEKNNNSLANPSSFVVSGPATPLN